MKYRRRQRRRLHCYDIKGERSYPEFACVVSEVWLPRVRPRFNDIWSGVDIHWVPKRVCVPGSILNLFFTGRVLERCMILPVADHPVPPGAKELRELESSDIIVFRYGGSVVWSFRKSMSMLDVAERHLKRNKKRKRR